MTERAPAAALALACAVLWGAGPAPAESPQPRLVLETEHIDLGVVTGSEPVRATFLLRNAGDARLEVMDLRASCGCIAALLSTPVLEPGEAGEIAVSLDPTRIGGRHTKVVTVYSNDPVRPVVFLKLTADARHPVSLSLRILHFGAMHAGEAGERNFSVMLRGEQPLTLASVEATSDLLTFTWELAPEADPPHYTIAARLAPGNPPGIFADTVRLAFAEPGAPQVEIPVRAHFLGPVVTTPTVLGLGLARRGTSPARSIHVTAPTVADFRVEKVESTSAHLVPTVEVDAEAGGYRVALHVDSETPRGPLQALLRVYTNAQDMPLVEVPVTAVIR